MTPLSEASGGYKLQYDQNLSNSHMLYVKIIYLETTTGILKNSTTLW